MSRWKRNLWSALSVAGALWVWLLFLRSEPLGPIPGGRLHGTGQDDPVQGWEFTQQHTTIYVEVRPDDPYSVTTQCFLHEGALYLPSARGGEKRWTRYLLDDSRLRLKIGEKIYRGRAFRVQDPGLAVKLSLSLRKKYRDGAPAPGEEGNIWFFHVAPAE